MIRDKKFKIIKKNSKNNGFSRNSSGSKVSKQSNPSKQKEDNNQEKKKKRVKRRKSATQSSTYPTNSGEGPHVNTKVTLKLDPVLRDYLSFEKDKILIKVENKDAGNKRSLNMEPYYHGFMARDVADKMQMTNGQFLLRRAEIEKRQIYIITVQVNNEKEHHMIQRTSDGKHFWIKKYCFNSVVDLIRYHMDRLLPIKDGVIITHWVDKDLWLLTHSQVRLQKPIGSGAFGLVFAGTLNLGAFKQRIPVAVKILKSKGMTSDSKLEFLREASIMTEFKSKYIIQFFGVCTQHDPVMIVIEMAEKGSLYDNLINPKYEDDVWVEKKHKYSRHVNLGLQYIHSKETLHRDIAARNVLIGGDDRAKIADFGLSLRQTTIIMKEMKKMPIRWLPPETLAFGVYVPQSEVWSFGVLLYEVYTDGKRPYAEITKNKELINKIINGTVTLIECPEFTNFPEDIQVILNLCFARDFKARLDMADVYKYFCKSDKPLNKSEKSVNNIDNFLDRAVNFLVDLKDYVLLYLSK
uniref:Tyrosine-protein kinase n=1 Tax=Strongyloides venezuelensis TaxID=75913 RepID=A0A0K0G314_STRVS